MGQTIPCFIDAALGVGGGVLGRSDVSVEVAHVNLKLCPWDG